jgi:hypothetical protein
MSRFLWTLCALLIAAPLLAMASQSTDFQRPDAWRYAVSPVIGDASYVAKTGALPPPGTDGDERVRIHLAFVHELLSRCDTSALPRELRQAREAHLASLREYIDSGVFPRNRAYLDQFRPCFIDDDGRICAVGYLVEQSAGRDVAERINAKCQYSFVAEMKHPELDEWIARSGLSPAEVAMIQPEYPPPPPGPTCDNVFVVDVTTSGMTVTIQGEVSGYDYWGECCGTPLAIVVDFGEAIWSSELSVNYDGYWWQAIDASHTYSSPGAHVIGTHILSRAGTPWSGYCFSASWPVNIDNPPTLAVRESTWGAIKALYR